MADCRTGLNLTDNAKCRFSWSRDLSLCQCALSVKSSSVRFGSRRCWEVILITFYSIHTASSLKFLADLTIGTVKCCHCRCQFHGQLILCCFPLPGSIFSGLTKDRQALERSRQVSLVGIWSLLWHASQFISTEHFVHRHTKMHFNCNNNSCRYFTSINNRSFRNYLSEMGFL